MKTIIIIAGIILTALVLQTNNSFASSDCKNMCCGKAATILPATTPTAIEPDTIDPVNLLIPCNHL